MSDERPLLRTVSAAYPGPAEPRRGHFIELLHRELRHSFRSEMLAPRVHDSDPVLEVRNEIPVRRFVYPSGNRPPKSAVLGPIAWLSYLRAAERSARDWWAGAGADAPRHGGAVLAHWVVPAGWIAARIARRLGVPLVLYAHGSDLHRYARIPGLHLLVRRLLRSAKLTIAASDELASIAARLSGRALDEVPVIPAGIDAEFIAGGPQRAVPPPWRCLFVGDLLRVKGFDVAAGAVLDLAAEGIPVELEVIGTGPLAARFARAGAALHCRGEAPAHDVRSAMERAHYLLLPSRGEGTPLVVQEALALRLPLVATRVGGIPDLYAKRSGWIPLPPRATRADVAATLRTAIAGGPTAWSEFQARMAANATGELYATHRATLVAAALKRAIA